MLRFKSSNKKLVFFIQNFASQFVFVVCQTQGLFEQLSWYWIFYGTTRISSDKLAAATTTTAAAATTTAAAAAVEASLVRTLPSAAEAAS